MRISRLTTPVADPRAVVSWAGQNQPVVLTVYSNGAEVVVPLTPVRALELAKELTEPAVQIIKHGQWGKDWPG